MICLQVTGGVLTSERWCDSSGLVYLLVTGGVTVLVGGMLIGDRWCNSNGMWCIY